MDTVTNLFAIIELCINDALCTDDPLYYSNISVIEIHFTQLTEKYRLDGYYTNEDVD